MLLLKTLYPLSFIDKCSPYPTKKIKKFFLHPYCMPTNLYHYYYDYRYITIIVKAYCT